MTAEKFMERTQMLAQTRASMEKADLRMRKILDDHAALKKEKEAAQLEARR
jgi:hypothetical protein